VVDSARKINSCRRGSRSLGLEGVRLIGMFATLVKDADGLGNLAMLALPWTEGARIAGIPVGGGRGRVDWKSLFL